MENFNCLKISVFILGDDKESELVCTTLPVVITAGKLKTIPHLCSQSEEAETPRDIIAIAS